MTVSDDPTRHPTSGDAQWYSLSVDDTLGRLDADSSSGLSSPLFVAVVKIIQIRRLDREQLEHPFAGIAAAPGA